MSTKCSIKLVNDHLIITENGQNILVDTGSPKSFHPSGTIVLGENPIPVQTNYAGVTPEYLSEKVGCEIHGMLGMDIIGSIPILFDLKNGQMVLDDNAVYTDHFMKFPLGQIAGGLIAITISVNGRTANVILDTGAPISYILPSFVAGLECVEIMNDFHPNIGDFKTKTFNCEVDTQTGHERYSQRFGVPPQKVSKTLEGFNIDGIIGIELFKRFKLQIRNGIVYLPPQGA